jgi:hypothetical protein
MIVRRVVTGVDAEGKSKVTHDGDSPGYFDLSISEFDVMWLSDSAPPNLRGVDDPADVDRYVMKPVGSSGLSSGSHRSRYRMR